MAGNTSNPRVWEGCDFYTAPVGAELPDFDEELETPWEAVGLLSEDGASESRDEDSNDFFAWGGKLVRTVRSKHVRQITVTCLEDNLVVFGLVNPQSTHETVDGVNKRTVKVPRADKRAFLMELTDGIVKRRRHIPTGEVSEVGEVTLSDSEMTAYELTIKIYPSAEGVLYYDYDNDPQGADSDTGDGGDSEVDNTVGNEV